MMATFTEWRTAMGYTQQQAAEALGLHLRTAQRYDAGGDVPKQTAMACAYLKLLRDLKALLPETTP